MIMTKEEIELEKLQLELAKSKREMNRLGKAIARETRQALRRLPPLRQAPHRSDPVLMPESSTAGNRLRLTVSRICRYRK